MKLGAKISSIDFSDAEKERIREKLLDSQSLQYRVLTTKGPAIRDNDFWRRAQKTLRVTGFRHGHPAAIKMVLARVLEAQRSPRGRTPHAAWAQLEPLYRRSVVLYVNEDLANLNQLLECEEAQVGSGPLTEQIIRCVVKSLPLYAATPDDVRELYELWGFERINNVDDILANTFVEASAVRRMVDDGVGRVRREFESSIVRTNSDLQRHVEQQGNEIEALKRLLQKVGEDLDDARSTMAKPDSSEEVPKAAQPAVTSPNKPKEVVATQKDSGPTSAAMEALQERVEGLGRQLKALRKRFDELQVHAVQPKKQDPATTPLTTPLVVINRWNAVFREVGVPSASTTSSWILLEVIRRSRIILTDKPQLLLSLIDALPNGDYRSAVASPLWISESDWKDSLAYISEDVGIPRVLVLEDFDVGLQEAYLVPTLIAWSLMLGPDCANRIVLVPSDSELSNVSPRIFELATLASHTAPYIRDLKRLGSAIGSQPPGLEMPQSGARVVGYVSSKNVSFEDQLSQYVANVGVSVPPRVVERFVSIYEGLRVALDARDAASIAQHSTLIPWIERARGEAVGRMLQETLRTLYGD